MKSSILNALLDFNNKVKPGSKADRVTTTILMIVHVLFMEAKK